MKEHSQHGATGAQGPQGPAKVTLEKKNVGATYEISEFQVDGSPERDTRLVDVLLIHGLTGDPIKTWGGSIVADNVVSDCWPRELAVELRSKATFWTLGYPAPLFNSQLGTIYSSSISQEGRAALEELVRAELGKKPIIFVSHSLGGLLAKSILVESARDSSKSQIFDNTHAVVFAGTPHAGSPHAKWRFLVPWVAQMAAKGVGVSLVGGCRRHMDRHMDCCCPFPLSPVVRLDMASNYPYRALCRSRISSCGRLGGVLARSWAICSDARSH